MPFLKLNPYCLSRHAASPQRAEPGRAQVRRGPPEPGALRSAQGPAGPLGQVSQQLSVSLSLSCPRSDPTAPQGQPAPSPRARGPQAAAAPTLLFTSMVPRPRLPAAPR